MTTSPRTQRKRRWLLGGVLVLLAVVLALICDMVFVEPRWLKITRVELRLSGLPPAFEGMTIVQLSDIHFDSYSSEGYLRRVVATANRLHPDVIVLTGDYSSRSTAHAIRCGELLKDLHASEGVYAVLGNHDHWLEADAIAHGLSAQGMRVLMNEAVPITRRQQRLWIAGMDDAWVGAGDITQALRTIPARETTILLVHEPDFADTAATYPVALQLSGHSHGGQVRLPFLGAPILPQYGQRYPAGLRRVGHLQVYTNRGIGMMSPPVRLNCRPEMTLFTLRSTKP